MFGQTTLICKTLKSKLGVSQAELIFDVRKNKTYFQGEEIEIKSQMVDFFLDSAKSEYPDATSYVIKMDADAAVNRIQYFVLKYHDESKKSELLYKGSI